MIQAAGLALAVMTKAKLPWASVRDDMPGNIIISDEQYRLMRSFDPVLELLAVKGAPGVEAARTVYMCEKCGRWGLVTTGSTMPKTCRLTLDCDGTNIKAKKAGEHKDESDDDDEDGED